jgi:hypothetical protein
MRYYYSFWVRRPQDSDFSQVTESEFRQVEREAGFLPTGGFSTPSGLAGVVKFEVTNEDEDET